MKEFSIQYIKGKFDFTFEKNIKIEMVLKISADSLVIIYRANKNVFKIFRIKSFKEKSCEQFVARMM